MYAGKTNPVPIPTKGGRVVITKNGYIYWITKSKWNNSKKRTIDNRTSIGHIDPNNKGMMFPGYNYFLLNLDKKQEEELKPKDKSINKVDNSNEKNQLKADTSTDDTDICANSASSDHNNDSKKEDITYSGSDADHDIEFPGKFDKTLSFGQYEALTTAFDKIGGLSVLKLLRPDCYKEIIALCVHAIDAQNSVAQDFPKWEFHNYCGLSRPLTDSEISRLYRKLGKDSTLSDRFMKLFTEAFKEQFPDSKEIVGALDSTNQNTTSKNNKYAEYGHPKVKEGEPDTNTAVFCDEKTGIPLCYEHFYGSILDKTETPFTVEKADSLGYERLLAMMDRGYCDKEVADAYNKTKNLHFGVSCPDNLTAANDLIDKYAPIIKDEDTYYLPECNLYGMHKSNIDIIGGKYDCYIFYDSKRADDERSDIQDKVKALIALAESRKRYTDKLANHFSKYLIIEKCEKDKKTGRNFTVKRNSKNIQKELDRAGFFVVVSNEALSAGNMGCIVKQRDKGEKLFQCLKSHFGLKTTHVHSTDTYRGKMFVAFIALIMIMSYHWYIRDILNQKSSETIATTIGTLSKYEICLKSDGKWMPMYAITKKQRELFAKLGLASNEVEADARAVSLRV